MRVWHDDVRPAPDGWVWARTNGQAKYLLMTHEVTEISLDHDLGLHDVEIPDDPDKLMDLLYAKGEAEETGLDLVRWMLDKGLVPEVVTIHSWNPPGAQAMAGLLTSHGHSCTVAPYKIPKT